MTIKKKLVKALKDGDSHCVGYIRWRLCHHLESRLWNGWPLPFWKSFVAKSIKIEKMMFVVTLAILTAGKILIGTPLC